MSKLRVLVVSHFASPYQVELFDSVARRNELFLDVLFLHRVHEDRRWKCPEPAHACEIANKDASLSKAIAERALSADLVVFNTYVERTARQLLAVRAASHRPWCFWGERPGSHRLGWLGQAYRFVRLRALRKCRAPIWGIGQFAIEGYQAEFGCNRAYDNIPYFSDLDRFRLCSQRSQNAKKRSILFSGSLSHRKGIDLLATAFLRVANNYPNLYLKVMGNGPKLSWVEHRLRDFKGRVEFIGFCQWNELPAIYQSADILCAPSRYDGWGLVVPEGLAAGMPVIATDKMGAAIDLIEQGVNGWRLPAGDLDALTRTLADAAALPLEEMSQFSTAAINSVERHSLASGTQRFLDACKKAVAEWRLQ